MSRVAKGRPLVIAHRGACGYLPEHTLPAKSLAYAMGADYLEQDVVASRDDELVVLHDIHLDTVTDVARRFPARSRDDGRFYVRDFDLGELKTLNVHERRVVGTDEAVYPRRFPTDKGHFSIPTLREEIEMVQGLNVSMQRDVGIYPEIKSPAWHQAEGVDTSQLLLKLLGEYGYLEHADKVFVQCFDAREVRRLRLDLGTKLKLIQLLDEAGSSEAESDYAWLQTSDGLAAIAEVADGIGPWVQQLYTAADIDGHAVSTGLVSRAHEVGLAVHPYTFRADSLPADFDSFEALVCWFTEVLGVDGLFTDFPDLALAVFDRNGL